MTDTTRPTDVMWDQLPAEERNRLDPGSVTPEEKVMARVRADHAAYVGRLIRATSAYCSDDSSFDDVTFPEPITLRITEDGYDLDRWMDAHHCDPLYTVELAGEPSVANQAVLNTDFDYPLHVCSVYGPSYHLDGRYEKPEWKVLA